MKHSNIFNLRCDGFEHDLRWKFEMFIRLYTFCLPFPLFEFVSEFPLKELLLLDILWWVWCEDLTPWRHFGLVACGWSESCNFSCCAAAVSRCPAQSQRQCCVHTRAPPQSNSRILTEQWFTAAAAMADWLLLDQEASRKFCLLAPDCWPRVRVSQLRSRRRGELTWTSGCGCTTADCDQ